MLHEGMRAARMKDEVSTRATMPATEFALNAIQKRAILS
jgi:hypothetical protein